MAYEFKKLADVELLESVPANANILVETGNAIYRAPSNKLTDDVRTVIFTLIHADGQDAMLKLSATGNMSFAEAEALLLAGKPLGVMFMGNIQPMFQEYDSYSDAVPASWYGQGIVRLPVESKGFTRIIRASGYIKDYSLSLIWYPDDTIEVEVV